MQRDGYRKSLWQDTTLSETSGVGELPFDILDVVVVGGGITGLSTALALRNAGLSCMVAEAKNIGFGTTGGTSAHINTVLELSYDRMISKFGEEDAKLVARGAVEACDRIRQLAELHAPKCNWSEQMAYLFAQDEKQAEELDKIVAGTQAVGLPASFVEQVPFPKAFVKAARFAGQAQFHPARYLQGLAAVFKEAGGVLMEDCRVLEVDPKEEALEVTTERGTVRARHLVYATHIPPGVSILHFRNAPYRSYVLAARLRLEAELPAGLVYDMEDPYHYYRTEDVDGDRLLIAGGCDHKTGHEEDTEERFRELESHVRGLFSLEAVTHQWSSQYFEPADGLPYIGKLPMADDRIYVATGFNGNGMTLGTLASIVLTDLITKKGSPYEKVFDPARVSVVAGFSNFVKEAVDVVGHLVAAPFPAKGMPELDELKPGDGRVVNHDGRSMAVHRDEAGTLHAVDPACSHIKCTVAWNGAERSWDCPCHGSRFNVDGEVLTAPSRKPLQRVDVG
ncbi:MAG: FAD-dependent oxidoreductase [Flavobacteriales bacterium]|nr:FAD-dependent oxidoreductase [Flavobacteriales bacterium]